ncbi:hypothetical protein GP954_40680, partial [Escherichia coli]|nr:hypothetical protein [Escherichia coli]
MEIRGGADGNTRSNYRDSNQTKTLRLEEQNRKLQQELLEERKNTNFTQTYPKGWERIRNLIQSNPGAA